MSRTAVIICPGRGTYNKEELGYLHSHHGDKSELFNRFDAIRIKAGQEPITLLDGVDRFIGSKFTRGDIASPLIYASTVADAKSISDDIEVVAVTGNSMGWYSALAVAGATSSDAGFNIVNTMGTLMQEHMIGGQLIYPFVDEEWRDQPDQKNNLLQIINNINGQKETHLSVSIDLGGMLVLAGNDKGLSAFEKAVPKVQGRFPMRLPNHAAFHSELQKPVSEIGQSKIPQNVFTQPTYPMIDGRGAIWWPGATDTSALREYTFGHQVIKPYDFTAAIRTAAREFAPDIFIITGPGKTLGGAVVQSLILCEWSGMKSKTDFQQQQSENPLMISMGMAEQRELVVK